VVEDRPPVDPFHDDVGISVLRRSAVEQAGDVGMLERGQDLALVAESPDEIGCRSTGAQELDRHVLRVRLVVPRSEPHRSHPAVAQLAFEAVRADTGGSRAADRRRRVTDRSRDREIARALVVAGHEVADLPRERGVVSGLTLEERRSLGRGRGEQPAEQSLDPPPSIGTHGSTPSEGREGGISGGSTGSLPVRRFSG
jgi:hypothetical protein